MKKTFASLMLCCVALHGYSQKTKLALDLTMGSTYYLTSSSVSSIDQELQGKHQLVSTTITVKVAHKVVAVRDTVYDLETSYQSMGMHMDVMGRTMDFNSSTSGQDPFSKAMGSMLNKNFLITISKWGTILNVKNTNNLYANLFDGATTISDAQKEQLKAQLQQSFSDKTIKANYQDVFVRFPKTEQSPNSNWNTNTVFEAAAISANSAVTYTLAGITPDAYLITGKGTMTPRGTAQYKTTGNFQMRLTNVAGTTEVKVKLDKATGWVMDSKITKSVKATVQIKDAPATPGGMTYPMSIISDITMSNK